MKQKLGLARALLHDPEILILDEPVSSLDPYGIKEVRDILMEENQKGKTIFISSHILSEIERTCHRVGIMSTRPSPGRGHHGRSQAAADGRGGTRAGTGDGHRNHPLGAAEPAVRRRRSRRTAAGSA